MQFFPIDRASGLGHGPIVKAVPHPYYAGLARWVSAQERYSLASLAREAGLSNTTILHALRHGNAPNSSTIDKIKEVTGLNYDETVAFAGDAKPPEERPRRPPDRPAHPGFSESDVAPWVGKPDAPETQRVEEMADFLTKGRGGRDVWRVGTRAMILAGYDAGDFILVDQHAAPAAGDVVIGQVSDFELGSATTLLRRYDPPVLAAASTDPADWTPHVVDGRNVKIMGVVTASWRMR
jgi:SOS-response transcriptional repressor LexA